MEGQILDLGREALIVTIKLCGPALLLGLTAAISGALVAGLLDHYFFNLAFPHSVALFWLYVGLATVAVRLINARREDDGEAASAS